MHTPSASPPSPLDRAYPPFELDPARHAALWRVHGRAPLQLYARGSDAGIALIGRLNQPQALAGDLTGDGLAVVGTRRPQPRATELARAVIRDLVGTSSIIVSGLARGIDTAAHESALEAGLPTIAALGTAIDHIYPPENSGLARRILDRGGLIVSEHAPGTITRLPRPAPPGGPQPPRAGAPSTFIERNRLIAGWAQATWVVQAAARSGALSTAAWARNGGRHVYATTAYPGDAAFAGNLHLIEYLEAKPLTCARSLSQTWISLHDLYVRRRRAARGPAAPGADAELGEHLVHRVRMLTSERGGAEIGDLLEWCLGRGATPLEFYEAIDAATKASEIRERQGLLIS